MSNYITCRKICILAGCNCIYSRDTRMTWHKIALRYTRAQYFKDRIRGRDKIFGGSAANEWIAVKSGILDKNNKIYPYNPILSPDCVTKCIVPSWIRKTSIKNFHDRLLAHCHGISNILINKSFFSKLCDIHVSNCITDPFLTYIRTSARLLFRLDRYAFMVIDYTFTDELFTMNTSFNQLSNILSHVQFNLHKHDDGSKKIRYRNNQLIDPIFNNHSQLLNLPYEVHVNIFNMLDKQSQLDFRLVNRYTSYFLQHIRITSEYHVSNKDIGKFYYDLLTNIIVTEPIETYPKHAACLSYGSNYNHDSLYFHLEEVYNFTNIVMLDISRSACINLESISKMTQLRYLSICHIRSDPKFICYLENLEMLELIEILAPLDLTILTKLKIVSIINVHSKTFSQLKLPIATLVISKNLMTVYPRMFELAYYDMYHYYKDDTTDGCLIWKIMAQTILHGHAIVFDNIFRLARIARSSFCVYALSWTDIVQKLDKSAYYHSNGHVYYKN